MRLFWSRKAIASTGLLVSLAIQAGSPNAAFALGVGDEGAVYPQNLSGYPVQHHLVSDWPNAVLGDDDVNNYLVVKRWIYQGHYEHVYNKVPPQYWLDYLYAQGDDVIVDPNALVPLTMSQMVAIHQKAPNVGLNSWVDFDGKVYYACMTDQECAAAWPLLRLSPISQDLVLLGVNGVYEPTASVGYSITVLPSVEMSSPGAAPKKSLANKAKKSIIPKKKAKSTSRKFSRH